MATKIITLPTSVFAITEVFATSLYSHAPAPAQPMNTPPSTVLPTYDVVPNNGAAWCCLQCHRPLSPPKMVRLWWHLWGWCCLHPLQQVQQLLLHSQYSTMMRPSSREVPFWEDLKINAGLSYVIFPFSAFTIERNCSHIYFLSLSISTSSIKSFPDFMKAVIQPSIPPWGIINNHHPQLTLIFSLQVTF